jgi:CHAT domain-containing protein
MSDQRGYLDFELRIDDLGGGRYRASVIDSPLAEGQAEVSNEFTLPFKEDDLNRTLAILSGQLQVSAAEREQTARRFGEALFGAVFAGAVYTVYFSSRDRARTAEGLRIKLALEGAGKLAGIPWEFLRDPAVDYLALSRTTPLVRHPRKLVIRSRPVFEAPLRVLVMISSPKDMEPLDAETEWQNLLAATESLRQRKLIELERLDDASLRSLQRALRIKDYHVFHYIGHSQFDSATGQGMLALEDADGNSFPVRGEDLARELSEENAIRLVVLNSCQSAAETNADPFGGIASSAVTRGLPAVVAMQYMIGEQAARVFSEEFYRAVAEGWPVDAAISEARRAINNTVGGIEWVTPVLFMRAPDGILFEQRKRAAPPDMLRKPALWIALAGGVILLMLVIIGIVLSSGDNDTKEPRERDLLIEGIELIPARPAPGEKVAILVTVLNNSESRIGPFSYDFREDVLDDAPAESGTFGGLGPGARDRIIIEHSFEWWGAFVSEVRIDVGSTIPEVDEFNNIRRSPVVVDVSQPFDILFDVLPDGTPITQSLALDPAAYAAWGFQLEVAPRDPSCANAVPWIFVEGTRRYLGTALPDNPTACRDLPVGIVFVRSAIGGLGLDLLTAQAGDYTLQTFDSSGFELDTITEPFGAGTGELELSSGFPIQLEITRALFTGPAGVPTQIRELSLFDPLSTGR